MNKLYIFGGDYSSNFNETYGLYEDWKKGVLPKTWPEILAKKIDFELVNMAKEGVSNYTIFSQFMDVCTEVKFGDILIFGWTNLNKSRIANKDNELIELNSRNVIEDSEMSIQTINEINENRNSEAWATEIHMWMKFINEFCLKSNIEPYYWTTDKKLYKDYDKFQNDKRYLMIKELDFKEMGVVEFITSPYYNNQKITKSTISQETFGDIIDFRLGEYGHINLAEFFYKYITFYTDFLNIKKVKPKTLI